MYLQLLAYDLIKKILCAWKRTHREREREKERKRKQQQHLLIFRHISNIKYADGLTKNMRHIMPSHFRPKKNTSIQPTKNCDVGQLSSHLSSPNFMYQVIKKNTHTYHEDVSVRCNFFIFIVAYKKIMCALRTNIRNINANENVNYLRDCTENKLPYWMALFAFQHHIFNVHYVGFPTLFVAMCNLLLVLLRWRCQS